VAPLWLKGIRGKKSTPSVGWEVLGEVTSVNKRELDGVHAWDNDSELSHLATVRTHLFLNGFPLENPTSDFIDFALHVASGLFGSALAPYFSTPGYIWWPHGHGLVPSPPHALPYPV
jgi:hypothetical protein